MIYPVKSIRGQMKIQQMAFVLVAIMIFFAMVSLFYFAIRISTLEKSALTLREEEAKETIRKIASSPEFSWSRNCKGCIDVDKVMALKNSSSYVGFWQVDYLAVEKIYPESEGECDLTNYPDCKTITIVERPNYGIPSEAFVSLCRWEGQRGYHKCELGRIYVAGETIGRE